MMIPEIEMQVIRLDEMNIGLKTANIVSRGLQRNGMVIAPEEPTYAMLAAGRHEVALTMDSGSFEQIAEATYKAMIKVRRDRG